MNRQPRYGGVEAFYEQGFDRRTQPRPPVAPAHLRPERPQPEAIDEPFIPSDEVLSDPVDQWQPPTAPHEMSPFSKRLLRERPTYAESGGKGLIPDFGFAANDGSPGSMYSKFAGEESRFGRAYDIDRAYRDQWERDAATVQQAHDTVLERLPENYPVIGGDHPVDVAKGRPALARFLDTMTSLGGGLSEGALAAGRGAGKWATQGDAPLGRFGQGVDAYFGHQRQSSQKLRDVGRLRGLYDDAMPEPQTAYPIYPEETLTLGPQPQPQGAERMNDQSQINTNPHDPSFISTLHGQPLQSQEMDPYRFGGITDEQAGMIGASHRRDQNSPSEIPQIPQMNSYQPGQVTEKGAADPRAIYDYFVNQHGMSPIHAAGVINNMWHESQFAPRIDKDDLGKNSAGLAQWRADRRTGLMEFADSEERDWYDWKLQADYLMTENDTDRYLAKEFQTPSDASSWFTEFWERPQHRKEKAISRLNTIDKYTYGEDI
jgi:hypothetical protein